MELKFQGDVADAVKCVQEIVTIGRAGELVNKKKEVLDHAFWAAGQFNKAFLPDDGPPTVGADCPHTVEGCCDALEVELPTVVEGQIAKEGITDYYRLLQLLLQLINLVKNA